MGNEASKQQDLRYLSDRLPFDEAELSRLVSGYEDLVKRYHRADREDHVLLLSEWASTTSSHQGPSPSLLKRTEQGILPERFGQDLAHRVLQLPQEGYDTGNSGKISQQQQLQHIEAYLEGLACCCGRRGSRASLAALFQLCVAEEKDEEAEEKEGGIKNEDEPPPLPKPESLVQVHHSKNLVDEKGREIKAQVARVVGLAYRLALATAVLKGERGHNCEMLSDDVSTANPALESMAKGCLEYVRQQRLKRSVALHVVNTDGLVTVQDDSDLDQGWCSKMDFVEWSEAVAPQLAGVLPAFYQLVLFPDHHQSSQSTSAMSIPPFQFPLLKSESAIWTDDNNTPTLWPVLFTFGCLSKLLGGEVSSLCVCQIVQKTIHCTLICIFWPSIAVALALYV